MSQAQEIGQKVQGQTLDAVRKTQDAVVEAVTAWTETADKIPATPVLPSSSRLPPRSSIPISTSPSRS